ncbi:MAG: dihydroneopterin aldolase [Candidatus Pelagibacter sp.]|nr:dihydroneopterin aldolase [Candidatus Pelagibacter sp.]OUV87680.1 MAG: hypothetical protein CBC96_01450 [Pelagibacteraceae bacterium TMED136]|tara:strand:- start:6563 stop:6958 length:396 start_codon:yes stop_codon:yes gene_type:complete
MNNKVIKIKDKTKTSEEIIHVKNLTLNTKFGFYPKEKKNSQRLIFNLKIYKIENIHKDSKLEDIVDYDQIIKIIKEILAEKINFLETLAGRIVNKIFDDKRIIKVNIKIEKPDAVSECDSVGYEITKQRSF